MDIGRCTYDDTWVTVQFNDLVIDLVGNCPGTTETVVPEPLVEPIETRIAALFGNAVMRLNNYDGTHGRDTAHDTDPGESFLDLPDASGNSRIVNLDVPRLEQEKWWVYVNGLESNGNATARLEGTQVVLTLTFDTFQSSPDIIGYLSNRPPPDATAPDGSFLSCPPGLDANGNPFQCGPYIPCANGGFPNADLSSFAVELYLTMDPDGGANMRLANAVPGRDVRAIATASDLDGACHDLIKQVECPSNEDMGFFIRRAAETAIAGAVNDPMVRGVVEQVLTDEICAGDCTGIVSLFEREGGDLVILRL